MAYKNIEDSRAYGKKWYEANKERRIPYIRLNNIKRIKKAQAHIIEYLQGRSCMDCGESNIIVLDFDHLHDKKKDIARMIREGHAWESILKEIAKCEIVCANCHRIRTNKRGNFYRSAVIA